MFKSGARRVFTVTAIVLASAVVQLVGPSAAHAANPQCDGTGLIIRPDDYGGTHSAWIPGYRSSNFNCWLLRGSHNSGVGQLQRALNYNFRYFDGWVMLSEDNDFGPNTEAGLRFAQRWWHDHLDATIKIDGGYGSQTRNIMCWPAMNSGNCTHY
ncbi:hypothetical protein Cme02nite_55370 [Catellatospora methionotrophica]|uniref:Peptidoglycan-binding protein n=2 Tax=Catellatospora methionotrophica TaxID=121620 RepID=A0A8J3LQX5_9ACTN|nr:hypothetical protein Cme02nite_55370 [Catellatospora methionotrophica]